MIRWLSLALCFSLSAWAQGDFSSARKYTQGELILETTALTPGAAGTAGLRIQLAPEWHTYWLNPGDSGSPIRLSFRPDPGLKVKAVHLPVPKRFQSGPLISFAYDKEVLLPIELEVEASVRAGSNLRLKLDAEWLICEKVCIPAVEALELQVPVRAMNEVRPGAHFNLFQKTRWLLPKAATGTVKVQDTAQGKVRIEFSEADHGQFEFVDFFPYKNAGFLNIPAKVIAASPLTLDLGRSEQKVDPNRIGLVVSRSKKTGAIEARQYGEAGWTFDVAGGRKAGGAAPEGLLWMLLSAFLGGLILNLMPCVFPILSMKLLSILKLSASHPREVRAQNFAYVAGVLLSFLGIAVLLAAVRSAGNLVGWGFQLQSPVFLSLLGWLFFILSLNLLGWFEIDFINASAGHRLTRLGGLSGSFFTGVLAVVVASPCTAPFMGVALGFGLAQPTPILVTVFLSLGLGLAFPYLVFALFPSFVGILPKPGAWMVRLKQLMALPLLLTTVWLLWVLGQIQGPVSVALVMLGCVVFAVAITMKTSAKSFARAVFILTAALSLAYIYRLETSPKVASEKRMLEGPWQPFTPALFEELKGQNVFVNMTADWCLTCKVNEQLVFSNQDVLDLLKRKNVVLIKGDWTQRNEDITKFLDRYGRVGVPFYVFYSKQSPEGLVLPEVLTVSSFKEWVEKTFP